MPYDVVLGRPQTPPVAQEICSNKSDEAVQTTNSDSVQETVGGNTQENLVKYEDLKESESKAETNFEHDLEKESEVELSKSMKPVISAIEEEDGCPICLEGNIPVVHVTVSLAILFVLFCSASDGVMFRDHCVWNIKFTCNYFSLLPHRVRHRKSKNDHKVRSSFSPCMYS